MVLQCDTLSNEDDAKHLKQEEKSSNRENQIRTIKQTLSSTSFRVFNDTKVPRASN